MRIEHVAIWTRDSATLERLRAFYETWLGATAGPRYESARRPGFTSCFLSFGDGARLELMTVPGLAAGALSEAIGLAHLAIAVGSHEAVDDLVGRMAAAGVLVESAPRTTGDGYYEAVVRDPDGNTVEITA
jgi:lactoylglutathione lyase